METLFNPKRIIFFLLALLLLLTGCKFLPVLNPYYAKALTPSPRPPTSTPAPTLTRTPTVSPTATRTPTLTPSPSPTPIYCDWAEVVDQGYEDVSTDGVYISGGSTFTYIWRLRNAGQCTWTPEYEMEVVEDDGLEVKESFSIDQFAVPGQIITIYLEIKVPDDTDEFTISWLLHNAEGESFGTGENADAPLELTFRVIQKPLPFAPVTRVPQAVVELCEMDINKERRINAFLKENAILPHLSEDSEDGITNEPEGYEPGMMMTFRVKDDSRNTFATLHKFLNTKRKTYVSIDGKYYVPDGTEVVFVEIPMTPPLKLLQKELQRLIPGYDGPTLTNEFPTMLGYYVHAIPLAGPDRCRPVVGAIFNDEDTEVYTAYRFPDEP